MTTDSPRSKEVCRMIRVAESEISYFLGTRIKITIEVTDAPPLNKKRLQTLVSEAMGIEWEIIASKSQEFNIVTARQIYCWLCNQYIPHFANFLIGGDVDISASAVSRAIKKVKEMLYLKDEAITNPINKIVEKINE